MSFGTVRKKYPRRVPLDVSVVAEAVPEMFARPPLRNGAVETWTSWLPAGPTTTSISSFEAKLSATRTACAESGSCVSPMTSRICESGCVAFQRVIAKRPHFTIWAPAAATGPVIGAAKPMVWAVPHVIRAASASAASEGAAADFEVVAPSTTTSARSASSKLPKAAYVRGRCPRICISSSSGGCLAYDA